MSYVSNSFKDCNSWQTGKACGLFDNFYYFSNLIRKDMKYAYFLRVLLLVVGLLTGELVVA